MTTRFTSEERNMRPLTQARINGSRNPQRSRIRGGLKAIGRRVERLKEEVEAYEHVRRFRGNALHQFSIYHISDSFEAGSCDPWHLLLMTKDLMHVESRGNPNAWS